MSAQTTTDDELADRVAALLAGRTVEIAGVLFDMDGTLVDSVRAVEESWRIMAEEFGVPFHPAGLHGRTAEAVVDTVGIHPDHRLQAIARLVQIESRPDQQLEALPGVRDFVGSLPSGHWGVVTSAPRAVARARYGASRLLRPEFFVTGDDVLASKPDPEPFARGVAALRARGREGVVLAVEDTVAGLQSARSAGCLTVGVAGTCTVQELQQPAHLVIDSFDRIRATVTPTGLSLVLTPR